MTIPTTKFGFCQGHLGIGYDDTRILGIGNAAFWKNGHMGFGYSVISGDANTFLFGNFRASAKGKRSTMLSMRERERKSMSCLWGGRGNLEEVITGISLWLVYVQGGGGGLVKKSKPIHLCTYWTGESSCLYREFMI